jgi:hypothetical protein
MFSITGPFIALSSIVGGGRIGFIQIITVLLLYTQTVILGSKSGFISLIIYSMILMHFHTLIWKNDLIVPEKYLFAQQKQRIKIFICIGFSSVLLFYLFLLTKSDLFNTAIYRMLTQFDAFYIIDQSLKTVEKIPGINIFEYWFSAPLKAIHLYSNKYNGINEYIVESTFGSTAKYSGLLPNNPIVLESLLCFGIVIGTGFLIVSGFLLGFIYKMSLKYVSNNIFYLFVYSFIASCPFALLLDGQNTINSFFALLVVYAFIQIIIALFIRKTNFFSK